MRTDHWEQPENDLVEIDMFERPAKSMDKLVEDMILLKCCSYSVDVVGTTNFLSSASLKLDRLPGQTTILMCRQLLRLHVLGRVSFNEVNKHLEKNCQMLCEVSVVDATIISAPISTKNKSGQASGRSWMQTN